MRPSFASSSKPCPVVLVPTYNERENIDTILAAIRREQPDFHICVIDDASPDGTGAMADAWAARDERIHVVHRAGKEGLGRAYLHGFEWALEHPAGFTHVFEMDADGSHPPRFLGDLLQATLDGADVALGSRYVPGGGITGWGPHRLALSWGGSLYARTVLGVRVRDLTGGFKCFSRHVLEALPMNEILTVGYGFQIEVTYRILKAGFSVQEVPIIFPDRERGDSKMSMRIFWEGVTSVWKLRLGK
ncbi:MAG: polyprenol monophosphomannose synthase [Myxococcota bacterium]